MGEFVHLGIRAPANPYRSRVASLQHTPEKVRHEFRNSWFYLLHDNIAKTTVTKA